MVAALRGVFVTTVLYNTVVDLIAFCLFVTVGMIQMHIVRCKFVTMTTMLLSTRFVDVRTRWMYDRISTKLPDIDLV